MNTTLASGEDLQRTEQRGKRDCSEREQVGRSDEKPGVRRWVTTKSVVTFGSAVSVCPKLPCARVDVNSLCGILEMVMT